MRLPPTLPKTKRCCKLIIDLHTHTRPASDDSSMSLAELVIGAKEAGLDGICVTDHDRFLDAKVAEKMTAEYGLLVVPGCEVTTEEGHLLVFGLTEYVFGMHSTAFLRSMVDKVGGAMVAAHPYRRAYRPGKSRGTEAYIDLVQSARHNPMFDAADAVEVLNGRGSTEENTFSSDLAAELRMRGTGSSDAHTIGDLGTFATEFDRPIAGLADLVHELRAGRFRLVKLDKRIEPGENP